MTRFVDYFAIIGVRALDDVLAKIDEKIDPIVLSKLPLEDWHDFKFPEQIAYFCYPCGWSVQSSAENPRVFCNAMTDVDGNRCYYTSLVFYQIFPSKSLYIPCALTIISRMQYFENFKQCLTHIFYLMISKPKNSCILEQTINYIVYNNNPTDIDRKFSLSIDKLTTSVFLPISPLIPTSDDCVLTLLRLVGIHNLTLLYSAILLDSKIVFISRSYTYLYKCTRGLVSLIYPIKFMYVYIPILPSNLTDIFHAPTPYLVGVHSSCEIEMNELPDVIFMNLDLGLLVRSESFDIPLIPEPYLSEIQQMLVTKWHPELVFIDEVYHQVEKIEDYKIDKYIRSCFLYLNLKLFAGYRPCTTFSRFVPVPVMKFHPSLFLSRRNINNCQFFESLFNTTSFAEFINERGPTYRIDDYFDQMINYFGYDDDDEKRKNQLNLVSNFAEYFIENESFVDNTVSSDMLSNLSKIDFTKIPIIDWNLSHIKPPAIFTPVSNKESKVKRKMVFDVNLFQFDLVFYINPRKQLMISQCVELIFQNKMSNAIKLIHAVEHSLTSKACQYELINAILNYMNNERTLLSQNQTTAIVRLFNFILNEDKGESCYSPAYQILKIATNFCQVFQDVAQFLYVHLQKHTIWKNIDFWVNMYFYETQACLVGMYQRNNQETVNFHMNVLKISSDNIVLHPQLRKTVEALDSSANILENFEKQSTDERKSLEQTELSFLYSLTIDFLDKISCMLIRYDVFKETINRHESKKEIATCAISKFKEEEMKEVSNFINNFLLKINRYVCLKNDQISSLQELAKNISQSQIDMIEKVCSVKLNTLSQDLTKRFRPFTLIENEEIIAEITGYVFYDISKTGEYDSLGSLSLLPAQGILYFSNKRLAFIGQSIDPFLYDFTVFINLPSKCINKFKVCEVALTEYGDMKFNTIIQVKSQICHHFQFAPTLSNQTDVLDIFKKILRSQISREQKIKHQNISKKADQSFKKDVASKSYKVNVASDIIYTHSTRASVQMESTSSSKLEVSKKGDKFNTLKKKLRSETKTAENIKGIDRRSLSKNSLLMDFSRMNLVKNDPKKKVLWRVSALNSNFRYSHNIPELFIVPLFVQDDLYVSIVKIFRRKRFPVCTFVYGVKDESSTESKIYALFRSEAPLKTIHAPTSSKVSSKTTEISHILSGMITTIDSLRQNIFKSTSLLEMLAQKNSDQAYVSCMANLEVYDWHPVPLYVFYDRNFSQSNLIEKMSCILIDSLSIIDIKKSFSEFQRAFLLPANKGKSMKSTYEIMGNSKWFQYLRQAILLSTIVTFLGDVCTSSTYFSFGDGVDMTSVLMCISQILIDPFYRTFIGFQKLIEKEWFEFNYNFYGKNFIEFIPVFIFFLDCVYQLTQQFPFAFEFNAYFLSFISYHNFSCKFNTFLHGDSNIDSLTDETIESTSIHDEISIDLNFGKDSINSQFDFDSDTSEATSCIFKYILRYVENSTVFHNQFFDQNYKDIIYPSSEICVFEIWPFYYVQNFQLLCMYNLETIPSHLINLSSNIDSEKSRFSCFKQEFILSDQIQNYISNTTMTYGYMGEGSPFVLDSISWMLFEIMNLHHDERTVNLISHPLLSMSSNIFSNFHITSSKRLYEFLLNLSFTYKLTETPKNIKAESEKLDPNLHELSRMEVFYPCQCSVCGLSHVLTNQFYFCSKCGVFIHQKCQSYASMLCNNRLKTISNISNEDFDIQSYESQASQLIDDELILQGFLYTKKLLSSWTPKYYALNKKAQTLNVYNNTDINSFPIQSYAATQISNCKELKTIPTNIPKDLQHVAGAFELKIKKKTEIFLTSKRSEASVWVRVLSKYING